MKKVGIFIETSLASGRQLLRGIASYAHSRSDWSLLKNTGFLGAFQPEGIDRWEVEGLIGRVTSVSQLKVIDALNVPTVDVLGNVQQSPYPVVCPNHNKIGRIAAEHFLKKGFRHLAFFGPEFEKWSVRRYEGFLQRTRGQESLRPISVDSLFFSERDTFHSTLETWLKSLHRPCGLFVASDQFAPEVFEAAQKTNVKIPEDLSVLGVDNDICFCDLCNPPLSSIAANHYRVGYEAAALLDSLMDGNNTAQHEHIIEPKQILERRSSERYAIKDPVLAAAMNYISRDACLGINVDHVASAVGVSRSVLQRKFKAQLQRTVAESIRDAKIFKAQELLIQTEYPIAQVAELSGFNSQEYLNHIFKKHLRSTPREVRRSALVD